MIQIFQKTFGQYVVIIIIALIILLLYYNIIKDDKKEHLINLPYESSSWNRNKCDYLLSKTLEDELNKHNINRSNTNWNIYFPCGYDEIDKEINEMPVVNNAKYFIIDNSDKLVAKEWLWQNIVNHYGINIARNMMPNSYILYNEHEMVRFNKEYDQNKIYIMKKNIQRQEGLKITNSKDEILAGQNQDYVLVQELLQNPYTISGRKTNMRFYILVLCNNGEINVYVHKDGFMYYTKELFKKNSIEFDPNITTGYIDRQIYIDNPLTHDDLRKYLDDSNRTNLVEVEQEIKKQGLKISEVYFNRIYHLLRSVFMAFVGKICTLDKFSNNVLFQLFGVDIAVDDTLNPMIMEINKGPDMGAKDERDSELKHGVMGDILNVIGTTNSETTRIPKFIRILDVKKGIINKTDI